MESSAFGKFLMIVGAVLIIAGAFLAYFGKITFLGKLPGDIIIKRGNFTLFFPIATSIIISIILTLVINLFFRR